MAPSKPTLAPKAPKSGAKAAPPDKYKVDWEALERDYRTGKFSLRQLEAKFGVSYAQISRKAKERQWTKDLRDIIRQATDAAVLSETVTKAQKDVTETIAVAAELNKNVILGHRKDAQAAQEAMQKAMAVVIKTGANVTDLKDAAVFASAVESLSRTVKNIVSIERQAFSLDNDPGTDINRENERYARMSMTERAARIALIFEKARKKAEEAGEPS